ncbi:MAG TPA: hypothetical protein VE869_16955 [Gemmatimonas sp.]|nr:hypothetical protein [Gemmatimonas sp.]
MPAPVLAPAPPPPPAVTNLQIQAPSGAGPADVYRAARSQREVLGDQLEGLEEKRAELMRESDRENAGPISEGTLARIKEIDARISAVDAQIAAADATVAQAAAIPGAIVREPELPETTDYEAIVGMSLFFSFACFFPFIIAYSRRMWRRGATVIAPVPQDVRDRLDQVSNAVDSIGLEVERIGEGQRFITKVLSDQGSRGLAAGGQREMEAVRVRE